MKIQILALLVNSLFITPTFAATPAADTLTWRQLNLAVNEGHEVFVKVKKKFTFDPNLKSVRILDNNTYLNIDPGTNKTYCNLTVMKRINRYKDIVVNPGMYQFTRLETSSYFFGSTNMNVSNGQVNLACYNRKIHGLNLGLGFARAISVMEWLDINQLSREREEASTLQQAREAAGSFFEVYLGK